MEYKRNIFGLYECPCCGYFTLDDIPDDSYEICPVCNWEAETGDPDIVMGANHDLSLNDARKNFKEYGVSDLNSRLRVRNPTVEEQDRREYDETNVLERKKPPGMYYPVPMESNLQTYSPHLKENNLQKRIRGKLQKELNASLRTVDVFVILVTVIVLLVISYFGGWI